MSKKPTKDVFVVSGEFGSVGLDSLMVREIDTLIFSYFGDLNNKFLETKVVFNISKDSELMN